MSQIPSVALVVHVDSYDEHSGDDVYLGHVKIDYRPYDGSDAQETMTEVVEALAEILRERLGWPKEEE